MATLKADRNNIFCLQNIAGYAHEFASNRMRLKTMLSDFQPAPSEHNIL